MCRSGFRLGGARQPIKTARDPAPTMTTKNNRYIRRRGVDRACADADTSGDMNFRCSPPADQFSGAGSRVNRTEAERTRRRNEMLGASCRSKDNVLGYERRWARPDRRLYSPRRDLWWREYTRNGETDKVRCGSTHLMISIRAAYKLRDKTHCGYGR